MTVGVAALVLAVVVYGVATVQLAQGSTGGVVAASRNQTWWIGNLLQAIAFALAFLARGSLPLLIVQPATTASIAVAALLGAALGRWRLTRRDGAGLVLVMVGIVGLTACAGPGRAVVPGVAPLAVLALALVGCGVVALRTLRHSVGTGRAALSLGAVSGMAFGISAVGSRALAGDPWATVRTAPGLLALLLLGVGSIAGQALLTTSLSGGAMAGPASSMHVVETVGPAIVGVAILGDVVLPGRHLPAVLALVVALAGSLLLVGHGLAREP